MNPPRDPSSSPSEFRSITSQLSPEDHAAVVACGEAELCGDAATAVELHRSVRFFTRSDHLALLQLVAQHGDSAPGWLISRWAAEQSRRRAWRGQLSGNPRSTTQALRMVVRELYPHGVDPEDLGCAHPEQVPAMIFGLDWAARQLEVYDLGALRELVDHHASPELLARADQVAQWCSAPMGGFVFAGSWTPGVLELTEADSGRRVELLDLGLGEALSVGESVIGRVVPTSAGPGRMFESRPLVVEPSTAVAVAQSPRRWLQVLHLKLMAGRLPSGFTHLPPGYLATDLPRQSWLTLVGRSPQDDPDDLGPLAQQALTALLRRVGADPGAPALCRHRAAELLLDPDLPDRTMLRQATASRAGAWRRLADDLAGPAGERCRMMAVLSAAAAEDAIDLAG